MKISFAFLILIVAVFALTACKQTSTVNFEAAIVYKMGGVQPVARQEFYLLDKDLEEIFKEQGKIQTKTVTGIFRERYYELSDLVYPVLYKEEFASLTNDVIPRYVKYKLQTDFQGKAQLKDVIPGTYHLYGNIETRGGRAVWNLRVDLKAGENSVVLDQNNAAKAR